MQESVKKEVQLLGQVPAMSYKNGVDFMINLFLDGNVDPIYPHLFIKKMEKIIEEVKKNKDVKDAVLKAARNHLNGGKTARIDDASIKVGNVGVNYDFSCCNDPVWNSLNEVFQEVKELKEARETMLKAAFPESKTVTSLGFQAPTVVVENTYYLGLTPSGEVETLCAPIKRSTESVVVTLDK